MERDGDRITTVLDLDGAISVEPSPVGTGGSVNDGSSDMPRRSRWRWLVAMVIVAAPLVGFRILIDQASNTTLLETAPIAADPPGAPVSISAVATAEGVELSWSQAPGAVSGCRLYRDGHPIVELPAAETTYRDNDITPGRSHSYHVRAFGPAGEGPPSSFATVTRDSTRHDTRPVVPGPPGPDSTPRTGDTSNEVSSGGTTMPWGDISIEATSEETTATTSSGAPGAGSGPRSTVTGSDQVAVETRPDGVTVRSGGPSTEAELDGTTTRFGGLDFQAEPGGASVVVGKRPVKLGFGAGLWRSRPG